MKILYFIILVSVSSLVLIARSRASRVDAKLAQKFTVDLDLPPNERWAEIIRTFKADVNTILQVIKAKIPQPLADVVLIMSDNIDHYVPYPYNEEIVGVAKAMGNASVADVLLGNLYYELTAYDHRKSTQNDAVGCTSIVAETLNGSILHARNMDYSLVEYLENITITVDFQKQGKTVYTGTTFAGYVGLVTGQKPFKYTISLDERNKGELLMNLVDALADGMQGAVAFRVRDILGQNDMTFSDAVAYMADKLLIAPCYIIMGGVNPGEGVVITRDRLASLDLWKLDESNGTWYVLETNYDHWTTPPPSDNRRDPAMMAMNDLTSAKVSGESLYNVLSIPPVFNHKTTYTVVMSAAKPEMYTTWVRFYGS